MSKSTNKPLEQAFQSKISINEKKQKNKEPEHIERDTFQRRERGSQRGSNNGRGRRGDYSN